MWTAGHADGSAHLRSGLGRSGDLEALLSNELERSSSIGSVQGTLCLGSGQGTPRSSGLGTPNTSVLPPMRRASSLGQSQGSGLGLPQGSGLGGMHRGSIRRVSGLDGPLAHLERCAFTLCARAVLRAPIPSAACLLAPQWQLVARQPPS